MNLRELSYSCHSAVRVGQSVAATTTAIGLKIVRDILVVVAMETKTMKIHKHHRVNKKKTRH